MATIQLHSDCPNSITCIPNIFIDRYMPEANGEFVKVYLYLLRNLTNNAAECSVSAIADCFNHTEKDVLRALKYWERMHLLLLGYGPDKVLRDITFLSPLSDYKEYVASVTAAPQGTHAPAAGMTADAAASLPTEGTIISGPENAAESGAVLAASASGSTAASTSAAPARKSQTAVISKTTSRRDYTLDEVKAFRQDPNISELFFIIETYLKHPMATTDINTVLYWYDELHFSTELIVYLVEYCISEGHSSMHYMDKVALRWSEDKITTVAQAKESVAERSKAYYGVMKAMGITGRKLVDAEVAMIRKWTGEYGFDLSLIQEACSRTIAATNQPSFKYADSILSKWSRNQVHSMEDVKKLDDAFGREKKAAAASAATGKTVTVSRNKFNNFSQRDYDYDQLERMALTTNVQ